MNFYSEHNQFDETKNNLKNHIETSAPSSVTSSIAELAGIFDCNDCYYSETHLVNKNNSNEKSILNRGKVFKPRKQHTLNSIESTNSRSRSPIVNVKVYACGMNFKQSIHNYNSTASFNHEPSTSSQTELQNNHNTKDFGSSINHQLYPDRISMQSFERRKSIFDNTIENDEQRNNPNNLNENVIDNLSLDQILDDIQAGKLNNLILTNERTIPSNRMNSNMRNDLNNLGLELKYLNTNDNTIIKNNNSAISLSSSSTLNSISDLTTNYSLITNEIDSNPDNNKNNYTNQIKTENFNANLDEKFDDHEHERKTGFEIVWLNFTYLIEPNIYEDPRWGQINKLFHKERRLILKGISGGVRSGQMVALMGPSGAGKTCLLECISGIRRNGIGGKILLRGNRKKAQLVIVPQYDNFMPQFTVEEIIAYGSRIKNSSNSNHKLITNEIIEQFNLQTCRLNNIQKCSGGQRKRVAIAQELVSKPNILILDEPTSGLDSSCCYQTMKVLKNVLQKSIKTNEPMAIITTIHQPSAKVFKMFDLIYLLSKTGFTAYSGPPNELLPTIKQLTNLECPQYSNPSDYMIELVSYDYGEEPVKELIEFEKIKAKQFVKDFEFRSQIKILDTNDSFELTTINNNNNNNNDELTSSSSSDIKVKNKILISNNDINNDSPLRDKKLKSSKSDPYISSSVNGNNNDNQMLSLLNNNLLLIDLGNDNKRIDYELNLTTPLRKATSNSNNSGHPFFWHTYIHLHRSFLQSIRDPILNNMRILIHIIFAVLLVLLYGKKSGEARGCPPILGLPIEITDPNNENMIDLADNVGYLFMCIMMITYVSLMSTVLTFPIDIKTVGKEYKNCWYGTLTYFVGKNIADLPFVIIYPIIYCSITWFSTNQAQDHSWRFLNFTLLIIMNAMNSQSFGLILGALFVNSVTAATFLGPVMTIPWYLFTGFTKRIHRLAEFYKIASKFLFTRFVFEGLLDTVYGHERCNCSEFLKKYYDLRYEEAIRLGQLISVETLSSLDYYDGIDVIASPEIINKTLLFTSPTSKWFEKTVDAASTVFADGDELNLASLMETNVKANSLFSFGLDFEPTCPSDYKNYIVQDFRLEENASEKAIYLTFIMLLCIRVLTFIVVTWKIRTREL